MKEKYLHAWMDNVDRFAQTSEAVRLKVAAFLFKDGNIVSHAINGTPAGWHTNICEDRILTVGSQISSNDLGQIVYGGGYQLVTKPEVVHAEEQCLQKMWNSHETTKGCVMLISHSPCLPCSIKLKTAGITKVFYRHNYRSTEGIDYLIKNGIAVEQVLSPE